MSLNIDQQKIIKTINGPILVIAGAGSGKTRVITYRIAYMIKNTGIDPSNILALTFTKKAAIEMKNRISKMICIDQLDQLTLGTFHSIFSKILRKESSYIGYNPNYTIYDQKDSENLIKRILKDINLDINLTPKEIRREISECKNNLYSKFLIKKRKSETFIRIYEHYTKRCIQSNALDFDDILLYTNHLFFKFPNILQKYQEKFKYILIDEYQDTNISQSVIIKNLSSKYRNIFVVGDDAQSIYAFRGANIANILNFHLDYNEAKIFRLEQNYRSTNYIVEASNNIISFNKNQITKKIWTKNEKGEKVKIYCASSEKKEAQYIANLILSTKENKYFQYKDIAILYRTNKQSYFIESSLKEKNIPYKIYGSTSLFKRKEIRDLLSYFKIIINPEDEQSVLHVINKIIKNKNIVKHIIELSKQEKITVYNVINKIDNYDIFTKKTKEKLKKIFLEIEKFRIKSKILDAYTIAKHIVHFLIEIDKNYNYTDFQYILYNVSHYIEEQKRLKNNGNNSLSGFLQYLYVEVEEETEKFNDGNKVSLMTVHLSKGLEFSIVFITGLEENIFPSKLSINSQFKIEEERRLFYVALTRAQKMAILTYTKSRFLWGEKKENIRSRFINELNQKFVNTENKKITYENSKNLHIKEGVIVYHQIFGFGTVLKLEYLNKIALINFKKVGKKRILLQLNKLIIHHNK
ncbi:ATP-dependent helicase [Blattabacterium cuenoti]|uniref:ATP-dependent helicase n=1 Tax=Blattabacterium cuenoti TaxID=1653831 RepID=UPI00163CCE50|nr:UvrD-helicase domain-containing protein [Blattabacterium cuenoti]